MKDFIEKWKREADCYVSGAMLDSPVGDMNLASADVVRRMLSELSSLPSAGAVPVDLSNHHNALTCPHCNPKGLKFAEASAGAVASTAVVWATADAPFTGEQVKVLLDENEQLRSDLRKSEDQIERIAKRSAGAPTPPDLKEHTMTNEARLALCSAGDVSDYGESLEVLPDSLGRSLAARIRLLIERADREAHLAVLLRQKLHEIAGPEVASAVGEPGVLPVPPREDDLNRCAVCGWSLAAELMAGCVRGNCSQRPFPTRAYAPARANAEYRTAGHSRDVFYVPVPPPPQNDK